MARSLNKVTLIGNLGADPEIRTTANGSKVANFSLATSRQWTNAAGEKNEKVEWHKCVAWNGGKGTGLADVLEKYAKKGDRLYVEGQIEYRSFEDKDKQTRYVTEINVREVLLLGAGNRSGDGNAAKPSAAKAKRDAGFEDFPPARDGDDDLPF